MGYGYITIDTEVEVDIDDVLSEMSTSEKEELCQELIDDGYGPSFEDAEDISEFLQAETYTERELVNLFTQMWQSRTHIDINQVESLRKHLQEQRMI